MRRAPFPCAWAKCAWQRRCRAISKCARQRARFQ
jgi:hypothetical protein